MTTISNSACAYSPNKPGGKILRNMCLSLFMLYFISGASAMTYYSKTNGDWNNPETWYTEADGNFTNKGTYPKTDDQVFIMDGHTVMITGNESCAGLNIGGGKTGILQYDEKEDHILYVFGSVKVNPGGIFQYVSNAGRRHNLSVKGDFNNEGLVKFCHDNNDYVSITFIGSGNSKVTGKGTWFSLAYMTMSKLNRADIVQINSPGFGTALTTGAATLTYPFNEWQNPPVIFEKGTFQYDCPDQLSNLFDAGTGMKPVLTINPAVVIRVDQGTLDLATCAELKANGYCLMQGTLIVTGGTVTVAKNAKFKEMAGLYYSCQDYLKPKLEITGGAVCSYGSFGPETPNYDEINFNMTGGTFTVNAGNFSNGYETFWITDRPNSVVNFTGGTIIIQKSSTYASSNNNSDFDLGGSQTKKFNVSGTATVQFGNTSTPESQTMRFTAYAGVTYPHFLVANPGKEKTITVKPYNSSDYQIMSLYIEQGQVFENKDVMTASDSHIMTITADKDLFSIYNDGTLNCNRGTIKFSGNSTQSVGGLAVDPFK